MTNDLFIAVCVLAVTVGCRRLGAEERCSIGIDGPAQ